MTSEVIQTRVPTDVKEAFTNIANSMGYSTASALKRVLILEAITKYPHLEDHRYAQITDLRHAIDRLRRNINQFCLLVKSDESVPDDAILATLEECRELIKHSLSAYGKLIRSTRKGLLK